MIPLRGRTPAIGCSPGPHAVKPISARQFYRIVVEAAQAADIAKRVGPHTLRHSFVTHLLWPRISSSPLLTAVRREFEFGVSDRVHCN
jgi:site-specific recombinase XerC